MRYTIPLLPCLVLMAGSIFWRRGVELDGARPKEIAALKRWKISAAIVLAATALLSAAHLKFFVAPDARTEAARWVLSRIEPGARIGVPEFPWYFTAAVTPHNGGSFFSGNAFGEWNESATNPVIIANWKPDMLTARMPPFVLVTDLQIKHRLRIEEKQAVAFMDFLEKNYGSPLSFGSKPTLLGLPLVGKYPPPDWEYHAPIVYVYRKR